MDVRSALKDEISNAQLAELLAREAERASGIRVRAYRRAARSAFLWPERADVLIAAKVSADDLSTSPPRPQPEKWTSAFAEARSDMQLREEHSHNRFKLRYTPSVQATHAREKV